MYENRTGIVVEDERDYEVEELIECDEVRQYYVGQSFICCSEQERQERHERHTSSWEVARHIKIIYMRRDI